MSYCRGVTDFVDIRDGGDGAVGCLICLLFFSSVLSVTTEAAATLEEEEEGDGGWGLLGGGSSAGWKSPSSRSKDAQSGSGGAELSASLPPLQLQTACICTPAHTHSEAQQ